MFDEDRNFIKNPKNHKNRIKLETGNFYSIFLFEKINNNMLEMLKLPFDVTINHEDGVVW